MSKVQEIHKKISDLQKELEQAIKDEGAPKQTENPDFSRVIDLAAYIVDSVKTNGSPPGDFRNAVFEVVMDSIYSGGFWTWWNKNNREG